MGRPPKLALILPWKPPSPLMMQPFGSQPVTPALVVHHAAGAPGLRWLGFQDVDPQQPVLKR